MSNEGSDDTSGGDYDDEESSKSDGVETGGDFDEDDSSSSYSVRF